MNHVRKVARMYAESPRVARTPSLTGLNREQLRSIAKRKGCTGYSRLNPAQLRDMIAAS